MLSYSQIELQLTPSCSLRCLSCTVWKKEENLLMPPLILKVLKKGLWHSFFMDTGILNLIGGDPLQSEALFELLSSLKSQFPQKKIHLWTHGLTSKDTLFTLLPLVDLFILHLPSYTEADYTLETGENGFTQLSETIQYLKEKRADVVLNHRLTPDTISVLPEIHFFSKKVRLPLLLHYDKHDGFTGDSLAYIHRFFWVPQVWVFQTKGPRKALCHFYPKGAIDAPYQVTKNLIFEKLNSLRSKFGL